MLTNTKIMLNSRPEGMPVEDNFRIAEGTAAEPAAGQVLVETTYLSLDPYMRGRISEAKNYAAPVGIGEVMVGGGVGTVVESRDPRFKAGDVVEGQLGWQSLSVAPAETLRRIDSGLAPVSTALGVLGMPGLTAYFATLHVGQPIPGDTVVVSGAGGAVGQIAGQLAKLTGARVVGIAGSDKKLAYCRDQLGFDSVINYKTCGDISAAVATASPRGVDVYLDGVGGDISAAVFNHLALRARIVVFGQISQSNLVEPDIGARSMRYMLTSRARAEGFIVGDWQSRNGEALIRLADFLRDGRIKYSEHVVHGLKNAPAAFIGMLKGENLGKTLVKVR